MKRLAALLFREREWRKDLGPIHVRARQSLGEYPIGLGLRLFYWRPTHAAPDAWSIVNLDVLLLLFDVQVGVHWTAAKGEP